MLFINSILNDLLNYYNFLLITINSLAIFRYNSFKTIVLLSILKSKFFYKNNIYLNYETNNKHYGKSINSFLKNYLDDLFKNIKNPMKKNIKNENI